MRRRKLVTGLCTAGVFCAGLGAAVLPASADPRTFVVRLLGGTTITVTLDVPPGTPADQITIPNVSTPIVGVSEATPEQTPAPPAPAPPAQTPAAATPAAGEEPRAQARSESQRTKRKRKSRRDKGDAADLTSIVDDTEHARRAKADKGRVEDGSPAPVDPTFALAMPGAAPIGVPNFFIEKFRIPPFLLPIYQAAGTEYGVRWEVLAAINEIETDYGRNLNVSSAGAVGWMQFMPATWKQYGVDANRDGVKDPYNPVDAIFAAARYLRAAGAETDLAKAVFAYNHAGWYVDSVLMRAKLIGGLPSNFVGSLTGLTQGHFPVHARATYARGGRAARIFARPGAPVIAVNDGKIVRIGHSDRLGRFVQLQDVYGNTYTYGHLAKIAKLYPAPRGREQVTRGREQITREREQIASESAQPREDAAPATPATATATARPVAPASERPVAPASERPAAPATAAEKPAAKEHIFANPLRPRALQAGGAQQILDGDGSTGGFTVFRKTFSRVFGVRGDGELSRDVTLKTLRLGSRVTAGTVLGRIGRTDPAAAPHVLFEIRPAGRRAPRIDPKPILDGWKLLESTAIYRAAGRNALTEDPSVGEILLMSKQDLIERVLANPRIEIYECGRRDIGLGRIDRRVLATLEFLAATGFKPTVTSLECGHGHYTKSGNVSHHSSGNAVDIAKINGIPVMGHQGPGSITELAVQRLLTLQGLMKPDQVITLMTFEGADNTFAMADHADHIHVGWRPLYGTNTKAAKQVNAILEPAQWIKLVDRLNQISNPEVLTAVNER